MKNVLGIFLVGFAGCTTYSGPFNLTAMLADSSIYTASVDDQKVELLSGKRPSPAAATAVVGVLQAQQLAWNRGDLDGFMQHYWQSKHLIFVSDGTLVSGWQAVMERYRKRYGSPEQMGSLTFSDLRIFVTPPVKRDGSGSDVAYAAGRWQVITSNVTRQGSFALVLERFDSAWKIVLDETTSDPP